MYKTRKRTSRGLIILLSFTGVALLLYLASFFIFGYLATSSGDPALASFPDIVKYYFDGTLQLFVFSYANSSNIAYFALSCFLYALIVCWVIFLIAAIIVAGKKKRRVLWWGVVLSFINLLVYTLFAAGSQKYWHILNGRHPFEDNRVLMFITLAVLAFGVIYFILSIASYFWSIVESYRNPRIIGVEVTKEEPSTAVYEEEDDEYIRRIVRDELIKNQPFKVIIVGNETKQEEPFPAPMAVEEVKEEPVIKEEPIVEEVKEEVKPEPVPTPVEKKVIFGTIDFWKVARTVWPQLDNPKPLPKEEKVEVVTEPAVEEDEEGWNRNKRQPFFVRVITAEAETKVNYNEIKNEILSYGVKARLSRGGETFRLKDKKYVKIYLVGKTLKVYLALSPEDYKDSTIPIEDVGYRPNYAEMPLLFKVRSQLSVRRCKDLIKAAMEKDGLTQGEVKDTNWVDELRSLNATKAKKQKA